MKKTIGFNMKVWQHHLDYVAQACGKMPPQRLADEVLAYISDEIGGRRSRHKTRTILFKIWINVPEVHKHLRDQATLLYPRLSRGERTALHWGLTVLAYPFFQAVVSEFGRLFRLQDVVHSQQIVRKMNSLYGERHSVGVSTSAVLSTLRQWGVIRTVNRCENFAMDKVKVNDLGLKQWFVEAVILVSGKSHLSMDELNRQHTFFPFDVSISSDDLDRDLFTITRQGFDRLIVEIV